MSPSFPLHFLVDHLDELLGSRQIADYCPNGLQVEASNRVSRVATGVSISQSLIAAARDWGAQMLIVHHGLFWKNENPRLTGIKGQRIRQLYEANISLLGYHLPLDMHAQLGNNAQLGKLLGIAIEGSFWEYHDQELGRYGTLETPVDAEVFAQQLGALLHREPLLIKGGNHPIRTVGWCSGGSQEGIEAAARLGLDAYISGEISEPTTLIAREMGIHYFASGHHATERWGVMALAEYIQTALGIESLFIDIDNPA